MRRLTFDDSVYIPIPDQYHVACHIMCRSIGMRQLTIGTWCSMISLGKKGRARARSPNRTASVAATAAAAVPTTSQSMSSEDGDVQDRQDRQDRRASIEIAKGYRLDSPSVFFC